MLTSMVMWLTHSLPQKALKWHGILMKLSEHLPTVVRGEGAVAIFVSV